MRIYDSGFEVSLKPAAAVNVADGGVSGDADDVFESPSDGPLRVHRAPPQCAASHGCRYKLAEFEDDLRGKREEAAAAARREEQLEALAARARADRERDAAAAELARETAWSCVPCVPCDCSFIEYPVHKVFARLLKETSPSVHTRHVFAQLKA